MHRLKNLEFAYMNGNTSNYRSFSTVKFLWRKKIALVIGCVSVLVVIRVLRITIGGRGGLVAMDQAGTKYHKILILGYMRSGSTLTGDLFQFHPDLFYVYEPLLYLWDFYVPNKEEAAQNLQQRVKQYWKERKEYLPTPTDFINYMFRCNLTAYNLDFLTNVANSHHFKETDCPIVFDDRKLVNTSTHCVHEIKTRCDQSRGVVLKVVRFTMAEADKLLELDPDVRIIHLVRDPRGTLFSRMQFNKKDKGEMHENYSNICKRVWEDLKTSRKIAKKHWGKILTVRYEDLAWNLTSATNAMHEFAGLKMTAEVRDHIKEMSSSRIQSKSASSSKRTTRSDPYQTAYNWRNEIPFSLARKIDDACKKVYGLMGYHSFSSENDMRNLDIPAKSDVFGDGLMTFTVK